MFYHNALIFKEITIMRPARLSEIYVVAAVRSDSPAQVLRNSRSEFRLPPLA